jgi:hypothetical protein
MPTTFRPCAPDQSLLFPPSPRNWLPEGHLAFFVADTVAALDLNASCAPYEGDGRRNQPFDPQMMVTVLRMCAEEPRLRDEIAALTTQAERTDVAENAEPGTEVRGDELPVEVQRRETTLATIARRDERRRPVARVPAASRSSGTLAFRPTRPKRTSRIPRAGS